MDAATGTAEFQDSISVGSSTDANYFANVNATGVIVQNPSDTNTDVFFRGRAASGDNKVSVYTDGSGQFAGSLAVDTTTTDQSDTVFTSSNTNFPAVFGTRNIDMRVDGSARFANVLSIGAPETIRLEANGSATFNYAASSTSLRINQSLGGSQYSLYGRRDNDGGANWYVTPNGSAKFAGNVVSTSSWVSDASNENFSLILANGEISAGKSSGTDGSASIFTGYRGPRFAVGGNVTANRTVNITANGSATFAGGVTANYITRKSGGTPVGCGITFVPTGMLPCDGYSQAGTNGVMDLGSSVLRFKNIYGTVLRSSNVVFELEADDDTKYTTTTDSEGNETRVYNGATLNVKEVIQNLVTRCDNRDAQIAALTTRIAQLELPGTPEPEPEPEPTPEPEPEPTPVVPHNLIPDTWTQAQRMAAMSELLQEYQANRD